MPGLEIPIHSDDHGPLGPDPMHYAGYHIIVRRHDQTIIVASPAFVFMVTKFMEGFRLIDVEAALVTDGDDVEIEVFNNTQSVQMLSSNMLIEAGEFTTLTSAQPGAVKTDDDALVTHGDQLYINVVDAGGGARGLEVVLVFV